MAVDPLIIVLTAIIVVIFWRLKSVLGQRTGFERPPAAETPVLQSEIIDLKANPESPKPIWQDYAEQGTPLALGLEKISQAHADFDVAEFLSGAKAAYEMILIDFAKGDKSRLKPLLSSEVAQDFFAAIDAHKSKGETKSFHFVGVKKAKLLSADIQGNVAKLDVAFESEVIAATLDRAGKVIDGDKIAIKQTTDTWTFEREISSRDPNWKLAATSDEPE